MTRLLIAPVAAAWLVLGGAAGARAAGPTAGDDSRTIRRDLPIAPGQTLRLELSYGELSVEPGSGDAVSVELEGHCSWGGESCPRRLAELDIATRDRSGELEVRVEGLPTLNTHGVHAELRVRVPAHQRVSVHMGAGEVKVSDLVQDLRVELGAGDIDIHMPESAVRRVDLQAGVGDAQLRRARGNVEAARAHLVGAEVHWDEGRGAASVDVQVGAGDVDLCLDN